MKNKNNTKNPLRIGGKFLPFIATMALFAACQKDTNPNPTPDPVKTETFIANSAAEIPGVFSDAMGELNNPDVGTVVVDLGADNATVNAADTAIMNNIDRFGDAVARSGKDGYVIIDEINVGDNQVKMSGNGLSRTVRRGAVQTRAGGPRHHGWSPDNADVIVNPDGSITITTPMTFSDILAANLGNITTRPGGHDAPKNVFVYRGVINMDDNGNWSKAINKIIPDTLDAQRPNADENKSYYTGDITSLMSAYPRGAGTPVMNPQYMLLNGNDGQVRQTNYPTRGRTGATLEFADVPFLALRTDTLSAGGKYDGKTFVPTENNVIRDISDSYNKYTILYNIGLHNINALNKRGIIVRMPTDAQYMGTEPYSGTNMRGAWIDYVEMAILCDRVGVEPMDFSGRVIMQVPQAKDANGNTYEIPLNSYFPAAGNEISIAEFMRVTNTRADSVMFVSSLDMDKTR